MDVLLKKYAFAYEIKLPMYLDISTLSLSNVCISRSLVIYIFFPFHIVKFLDKYKLRCNSLSQIYQNKHFIHAYTEFWLK